MLASKTARLDPSANKGRDFMGLKGWLFAALLLVLSGGACAEDRQITVQVLNGLIIVPESTAQVQRAQGKIVWELVTPGYRFAKNGSVISAPAGVFSSCRSVNEGTRFQCTKDKHPSGDSFRYVLNVTQDKGPPPKMNPYINLDRGSAPGPGWSIRFD
jgi:hypothetical protein